MKKLVVYVNKADMVDDPEMLELVGIRSCSRAGMLHHEEILRHAINESIILCGKIKAGPTM